MQERDILDLAQSQSNLQGFNQALLVHLMRFIGADVALFDDFHGGLVVQGIPPASLAKDERQRHAAELKPVLDAAYQAGAAVDTHVLGLRRVQASRYYNDFVRTHGGLETLFAFPKLRGRAVSFLFLGRARGAARFHDRDVASLQGLLPAIAVAAVAVRASAGCGAISLSRREVEIVDYLRRGFRSAEIAAILGTSVNTVRNQVARLMSRAGASTRAELVMMLS